MLGGKSLCIIAGCGSHIFLSSGYIRQFRNVIVAGLMPLPLGFPHQGPARHHEVSLKDIIHLSANNAQADRKTCASAYSSRSTLHWELL